MPVFTSSGGRRYDLWQVDGSNDMAWCQSRGFEGLSALVPIRLHVGNNAFGQRHIDKRHGVWIKGFACPTHEVVWRQLQMKGQVYSDDCESKLKIRWQNPSDVVMVLKWQAFEGQGYLSVVTFYKRSSKLNDKRLGWYTPVQIDKKKAGQ